MTVLPIQGTWVQFLVGELSSNMLHIVAKKNNYESHIYLKYFLPEFLFCLLTFVEFFKNAFIYFYH